MTIEDIGKIAPGILGIVSVIGGFIYWHFKTINAFKDDVHKLEL